MNPELNHVLIGCVTEATQSFFFVLQVFPKMDLLLDNESQGSGVYLPELDEPEHCNAQNTALWELHLLQVSN